MNLPCVQTVIKTMRDHSEVAGVHEEVCCRISVVQSLLPLRACCLAVVSCIHRVVHMCRGLQAASCARCHQLGQSGQCMMDRVPSSHALALSIGTHATRKLLLFMF
eukprot:6160366-Amphidinium_carterae.2